MNKIYKLLIKIHFPTVDKLKHLLIGDYIANATFLIIGILIFIFKISEFYFCFLPLPAIIIGGIKEYLDRKSGKGTPEFADFFYTIKTSIQYLIIILLTIAII